jgi:hypothetical protein
VHDRQTSLLFLSPVQASAGHLSRCLRLAPAKDFLAHVSTVYADASPGRPVEDREVGTMNLAIPSSSYSTAPCYDAGPLTHTIGALQHLQAALSPDATLADALSFMLTLQDQFGIHTSLEKNDPASCRPAPDVPAPKARGGGVMRRSVEQQRAAGRKRAQAFTREYQQEQACKRVAHPSFLAHNRRIAPDGFAAQSAHMRATNGQRLLHARHVQFLRPEELRGPHGRHLSHGQQRLAFGLYVWQTIWEFLAPQPEMPTDEEFLAHVVRIQSRLQHGLPLENALDIVYAAPGDFCDAAGSPWSPRKQRRLFREALRAARVAAEAQIVQSRQEAQAERMQQPHNVGQRRPMPAVPMFRGQARSEGGQQ